MTSKQRRTCALILCVLAACSAALCLWVLQKEQPQSIAAFEKRFADPAALGFAAEGSAQLVVDGGALSLAWPEGGAEPCGAQSEWAAQGRSLMVSLYAAGTQNGWADARWGFGVWLEAELLRGGETVATGRIELPLESEKGRARACALHVAADEPFDRCRLRVRVAAQDGDMAAGELTLSKWEVTVR